MCLRTLERYALFLLFRDTFHDCLLVNVIVVQICKSTKVGMLITSGGLRKNADFLKLIDQELLSLLYEHSIRPEQIQLNFRNPQMKDILGQGN